MLSPYTKRGRKLENVFPSIHKYFFKIILDQDHFCSMFFHSSRVNELSLTPWLRSDSMRRPMQVG